MRKLATWPVVVSKAAEAGDEKVAARARAARALAVGVMDGSLEAEGCGVTTTEGIQVARGRSMAFAQHLGGMWHAKGKTPNPEN